MSASVVILIFLLVFVLLQVPIIGQALKAIETLIHESGHAYTGTLLNGKVESVKVNERGGVTQFYPSTTTSFWVIFVISISGYVGSSAFGFFCAWSLKTGRLKEFTIILITLALAVFLLWIKSSYGQKLLPIFIATYLTVLYFKNDFLIDKMVILWCFVLNYRAVYMTWVVLKNSILRPNRNNDAKALQDITKIPSPIWGMFFFLQAIGFALASINLFYPLSNLDVPISSLQ